MSHAKSRGSLVILAFIAVYTVAHVIYIRADDADLKDAIFLWAGAVSLICMSIAILISIRPKLVEGYFGGLDRMYQVHKWLGITAMLCFALHFGLTFGEDGGPPEAEFAAAAEAFSEQVAAEGATDPAEAFEGAGEDGNGGLINATGMYPMIGFFILIILTLNRKVPYHHWLKTHLLMGVLFGAVSLHAFLVLQEGFKIAMFSIPGIIILLTITAGVLGYLYKQSLYRSTQRHQFTLAEVNHMERATEVVLSPNTKRFDFRPGQFAFLRIKDKGFDEYHPFTISSGTGDGNIRFTMKMLGDFTRRVHHKLVPGAEVLVEGPYGRFDPLGDRRVQQVWIAGGIGITPFLATLRSLEPEHGKTVDLFYCVREEAEALYLEEIRDIAANVGGINVHLFSSDTNGRLTDNKVADVVTGSLSERNFYFCGPKPMLVSLKKGLESKGVSVSQFHFEEFEMR